MSFFSAHSPLTLCEERIQHFFRDASRGDNSDMGAYRREAEVAVFAGSKGIIGLQRFIVNVDSRGMKPT